MFIYPSQFSVHREAPNKYLRLSSLGNSFQWKHNYSYSAYFPQKFSFSEVVFLLVCYCSSIFSFLNSTGRLPQPDLNRLGLRVQSLCVGFFRLHRWNNTPHDEIILLWWWPIDSSVDMFTSLDIRKGSNNSLPFSFTTKLFKLLSFFENHF